MRRTTGLLLLMAAMMAAAAAAGPVAAPGGIPGGAPNRGARVERTARDTHAAGAWLLPSRGGAAGGPWQGAYPLGNGWWWLDWFGYFNATHDPWLYHVEHGWFQAWGSDPDSIWIWDDEMNAFWWTSHSVYPFVLRAPAAAWLWYVKFSARPRWFRNMNTGFWETYGPGFGYLPFRVVGYTPNNYPAPPRQTMECLTHVIAFSLQMNTDGSLNAELVNPDLSTLVSRAHEAGARALVGVGGAERSGGFSTVAASAVLRAVTARNLKAYCAAYRLDGVDIDWEFPTWRERFNLEALLAAIRREFGADYLLAVAMSHAAEWFLPASAYAHVDWINIMAYDDGTPHSPYHMVYMLDRWHARGIPKSKLLLGVPFYGRNRAGDAASYARIVADYDPPAGTDQAGGYYFNGIDTITAKTAYSEHNGYGGVAIWELNQDVAVTDTRSLLSAIHDEAVAP